MPACTRPSAAESSVKPSNPLIATQDLSCGYSGREVLKDVQLTLMPGSITALLGPNGSGKSTLLKTLCGSLPPLSGQVLLNGEEMGRLSYSEIGRRVAFVPQEEHPTFKFLVREIVLMGRMPHSGGFWDSPDDKAKAEEAMRAADCLDLQHRPVTELSGGERQRTLIARALAQEAPALLLDEPTSHLDVGHQLDLARLLKALAAEGRAVLAAVHDLNFASILADRAVLLGSSGIAMDAPCEAALESDALSDVYGVRFERLRDEEGRLRVFPRAH
jgi:iron complex transport system ATP-binding protein